MLVFGKAMGWEGLHLDINDKNICRFSGKIVGFILSILVHGWFCFSENTMKRASFVGVSGKC